MLLTLENVSFGYDDKRILEHIGFTISEGERIGLIGPNGEGKTTLLKLMSGALAPDEGKVLKKSGLKIGYLEQNGGLESARTVYEEMQTVFFGRTARHGRPAGDRRTDDGGGGRERRIPRPVCPLRAAGQTDRRSGRIPCRRAHPHRSQRHGVRRYVRTKDLRYERRRKDAAETVPAAARTAGHPLPRRATTIWTSPPCSGWTVT